MGTTSICHQQNLSQTIKSFSYQLLKYQAQEKTYFISTGYISVITHHKSMILPQYNLKNVKIETKHDGCRIVHAEL
jgi:uncharacterized protein YbcV (DUF1398 family)